MNGETKFFIAAACLLSTVVVAILSYNITVKVSNNSRDVKMATLGYEQVSINGYVRPVWQKGCK